MLFAQTQILIQWLWGRDREANKLAADAHTEASGTTRAPRNACTGGNHGQIMQLHLAVEVTTRRSELGSCQTSCLSGGCVKMIERRH